jgi:UDP-glucose 4-epimerase
MSQRVLITGASGHVGRRLVEVLAEDRGSLQTIIATDIRAAEQELAGVVYRQLDICDSALGECIAEFEIDTVVHLAAIVTPPPGDTRGLQYRVDVEGTENVVAACVKNGVKKLVYTSSGAAYGYSADNSGWLREDAPLRGNREFAYAWHKRLVEERLAEAREKHPDLKQLIFRVSTVLGEDLANQITALFEKKVVVGIKGVDSPFCFIWDEDVAHCLAVGIQGDQEGIYNLTGDGVMTLREVALAMGGRYVGVPERWLRRGLKMLKERELTAHGPEQLLFLRYRPVLCNERLKEEFGFIPQMNSRQVFDFYRISRS